MLRHQLRQDLILGLDLLFQILDTLLLGLLMGWALVSKAAPPFSKNSFCHR